MTTSRVISVLAKCTMPCTQCGGEAVGMCQVEVVDGRIGNPISDPFSIDFLCKECRDIKDKAIKDHNRNAAKQSRCRTWARRAELGEIKLKGTDSDE